MLGILTSRKVAHITATQQNLVADTASTGNPLWDIWVNSFDITKMLNTSDIDPNQDVDKKHPPVPAARTTDDASAVQHVPSLLNVAMIDEAVNKTVALANAPGAVLRAGFSQPFRVAVTLSNLRGIPFTIKNMQPYGGFTGSAFVEHDDFAWFAFPNGAAPADNKREDEFWLSSNPGVGEADFSVLGEFAAASGSLPIGLPARYLQRPAEHYLYRPSVRAVATPPGYSIDYPPPAPDWSELPDVLAAGSYTFSAVDGGCFNNDPVKLVHRALAGMVGVNPQDASEANRAMLMIDPLADQPSQLPLSGRSVVRVLGDLAGLFTQGGRYLTADMDLFRDADVFSRFQLVPTQTGGRVGEQAVAGASLMALAGWFAREFRVHDFLLGRANMKKFLETEFVLAGNNSLFDKWSQHQRDQFAVDKSGNKVNILHLAPDQYLLPILPDLTAADSAPLPAWPDGACSPDDFQEPIRQRLDAVLKQLQADNLKGPLAAVMAFIAVPLTTNLLASAVVKMLTDQLSKAGLMGNAPPSTPKVKIEQNSGHQ